MNTINREQFEAWLFSQPPERTFKYTEGTPSSPIGCLACNYLREMTDAKNFFVGPSDCGIRFGNYVEPYTKFEWLAKYLYNVCYFAANFDESEQTLFTAKDAKRIYSELFPNAIVGNNDIPAIAGNLPFNSIASVTESNATNMLNSPSKLIK